MISKAAGWVKHALFGEGRISYSQCGEDMLVEFALDMLGNRKPRYLDIGANDPVRLNNTFRLYRQGCSGACVEPNPALAAKIRRARPRDLCIEAAVAGRSSGPLRFFVLDPPELSTFVESEALGRQKEGAARIEREVSMPTVGINDLLATRLGFLPQYVSLDIEGMDLEVIRNWDFSAYRPLVLSAETVTYSANATGAKVGEVFEIMTRNGYTAFADTYLNTIFVDGEARKHGASASPPTPRDSRRGS